MFKDLRQRIGQGLTPSSGRGSVIHGQVVMSVFIYNGKMRSF